MTSPPRSSSPKRKGKSPRSVACRLLGRKRRSTRSCAEGATEAAAASIYGEARGEAGGRRLERQRLRRPHQPAEGRRRGLTTTAAPFLRAVATASAAPHLDARFDRGHRRNARRILKLERYNKDFDLEDAINTANALHRTLMERELPISQDGYAKAASILHRKNKTSAPRVVQGMQQLSTAFLVLQAGARGFIARQYARLQEEQRRATCDSAALVLVDFFAVSLNRSRMSYGFAELISRVQASTKIASVMRGKRARGSFAEMAPSCVLSRRRRSAFGRPTLRGSKGGVTEKKAKAVDMMVDFLREARVHRNTIALRLLRQKLQPIIRRGGSGCGIFRRSRTPRRRASAVLSAARAAGGGGGSESHPRQQVDAQRVCAQRCPDRRP